MKKTAVSQKCCHMITILWKKYLTKSPRQVHTAKYCDAIQVLENFFNCGDGLTFSNNYYLVATPHVNADYNITIRFGCNNK